MTKSLSEKRHEEMLVSLSEVLSCIQEIAHELSLDMVGVRIDAALFDIEREINLNERRSRLH